MTARLFVRPLAVERDLLAGEAIGNEIVAKINNGCSDPDALLRTVLGILADQGHMVPPSSLLRAALLQVQVALEARNVR